MRPILSVMADTQVLTSLLSVSTWAIQVGIV